MDPDQPIIKTEVTGSLETLCLKSTDQSKSVLRTTEETKEITGITERDLISRKSGLRDLGLLQRRKKMARRCSAL
jgi:hypothetical protein